MSFVKRRIDVTISLGEGQFGDQKGPDVTLTGHRVQVVVVSYNGDAQAQMQMRIYGLPQDVINKLTTVGPVLTQRRGQNRILVEAGDAGQALSVLYEGKIDQAWADYNQAPEVVFYVTALAEASAALKPVPARSYRTAVSVVDVARDIATSLGLAFESNQVEGRLVNPYFPGTAIDQLRALAKAARFNYTIEGGILAIWPWDGGRQNDAIAIDSATNMIGYPAFTGGGIVVRVLYEPRLGVGKKVQVVSVNEGAHGEWIVVSLVHSLDAESPGGAWVSEIMCVRSFNG
ncbi:baseplate hub protein [Achromobacter xylosoxidans]